MEGCRSTGTRAFDTRHRVLAWAAIFGLALGAALFLAALASPAARPFSPLLALLLVPAAELALTPLWRRAGVYRYYSPFLFLLQREERRYELHGGTAFDYLWHLRWSDRGRRATRLLLCHYLSGLLAVIDDIEHGRLPGTAVLVATSYVFNERTAKRLGFTARPAPALEQLHFLLGVLSLSALFSYARGRLALPEVWRVRCWTIDAALLARQKPAVRRLLLRLSTRAGEPAAR